VKLQTTLRDLATDPDIALDDDRLLRFVLAGGLRSPDLDRATVRALLAVPAARGRSDAGSDQISVRLVPPGVDPGLFVRSPAITPAGP
jgi:hypothetical protein